MFLGSVLCAVAVNGILIPKHFASGGVSGLCIVIQKFIPCLNFSLIYFLINIPLFILAWMNIGKRFFVYSIIGVLFFVFAIAAIDLPVNINDMILSSLLAGLLFGAGTGIALRSSGSQGGLDILSVMLLRRFSITLGNTVLVVNAIVLSLVALFYSLDAVLYTLIVIYVSSKVTNVVVVGMSERKMIVIISPHWEEISKEILKDIRRGVTVIEGKGGFTGKEEHILYTVIPIMDIGPIKTLIHNIDPDAFIVISDTLEVINSRIGNQPHW